MPKLDSPMHVAMLKHSRTVGQIERDGIYGLQWGDPQTHPALRWVRDHYLLPYVNPDHSAVEIGPGGGRWTRYLLGFGQLCTVDYHQELLDELLRNYRAPHLSTLRNNGTDFPDIPDASIDFVFSFGVFVHLDIDVIEAYFRSIHRILKPSGCALIQYSDKNKEAARKHGQGFSDTTPEIIRPLVIGCGHRILEDDTTTMWHSSIVRFAPNPYPEKMSNSQEVKSRGAPPVPRVMNEVNYGSLLDIVSRIKRTRGFARPDDFTTVSDGSSAEQSMCPLMYCVDFKTQQVIYTVHDPENINVTLAEPFLFVAQLQHARKILALPIEHIGSTISTVTLRPTFIFSPGRAGSTLLSAMFKAIGKPTASEPDAFTQVAMLAPSALARSSNLDMQIVTACVSNLSDYLGPEPIIKLRSQCNAAPERIIGSVANARAIFLLRDRKPWAQSRHRAFREPPRTVARILAETIVAIDRLQQIGAAPQVIWYEDLVAHPWATLAKIMMGSQLQPSELDERLTAALAADSQAGTQLAQANVAKNPGDDGFLDQFEAEWEAAQPREVMDRLGLPI